MGPQYAGFICHVGNSARQFQDLVIAARSQLELINRSNQQSLGFLVEFTEALDLLVPEIRVETALALQLKLPGADNPCSYLVTIFLLPVIAIE